MEGYYRTDWEGDLDYDSAFQYINWKIGELITNDGMSAQEAITLIFDRDFFSDSITDAEQFLNLKTAFLIKYKLL